MARLADREFEEMSNEEAIIVPQAEDYGLQAFRWQPQREDGYEADNEAEDEVVEQAPMPDRQGKLDGPVESWCTCGNCSVATLRDKKNVFAARKGKQLGH